MFTIHNLILVFKEANMFLNETDGLLLEKIMHQVKENFFIKNKNNCETLSFFC